MTQEGRGRCALESKRGGGTDFTQVMVDHGGWEKNEGGERGVEEENGIDVHAERGKQ